MDKFVYTKEWREQVEDIANDDPESELRHPSALYKDFVTEIEKSDEAKNTFNFIISSETQDRYGDVVELDGWDFENFFKSGPGPVLFAHRSGDLPVGTSPKIWAEDGLLKAQVDFVSRDIFPMAGVVRDMVAERVLKSASVGFMPLEWTFDEEIGGFRFKRQELLEFSIVPIPANPDAVITNGLDFDAYIDWFKEVSKENGLFVCDERKVKALISSLGIKQKMTVFDLGEDEIKSVVTKRVKDPTIDMAEFDETLKDIHGLVGAVNETLVDQEALIQELRTEIDMLKTVEDDPPVLTEENLKLLVEDKPEEFEVDLELVGKMITDANEPLRKAIKMATGRVV
jgi:hypothetical protein